MNTLTEKVVSQVSNRRQAEEVVTELLLQYSGETAYSRLAGEAQDSKQSADEVARRIVSNLFTRLNTRR